MPAELDIVAQTRSFWKRTTGMSITSTEAAEIVQNMFSLFDLLSEHLAKQEGGTADGANNTRARNPKDTEHGPRNASMPKV